MSSTWHAFAVGSLRKLNVPRAENLSSLTSNHSKQQIGGDALLDLKGASNNRDVFRLGTTVELQRVKTTSKKIQTRMEISILDQIKINRNNQRLPKAKPRESSNKERNNRKRISPAPKRQRSSFSQNWAFQTHKKLLTIKKSRKCSRNLKKRKAKKTPIFQDCL